MIDVVKLAREAGIVGVTEHPALERFAALIVEECATGWDANIRGRTTPRLTSTPTPSASL